MSDNTIHRKITWDEDEHKKSIARKKQLPENTLYAEWGRLDVRRDMLLLGAMFWTCLDSLEQEMSKQEMEMSPEIANYVMRSMQVMLKNVPVEERRLLSQVLYSDAELCLTAANCPNARARTLAVAHLIVKLTDEGLVPDPTSNLVLAALAIVTEAQEDGVTGLWRYLEREVVVASGRLWERAQLAGYLATMIPKA